MIPAPFVILEYIFKFVRYARNFINGTLIEQPGSFRKNKTLAYFFIEKYLRDFIFERNREY